LKGKKEQVIRRGEREGDLEKGDSLLSRFEKEGCNVVRERRIQRRRRVMS
jgi:hypothetical protein